MTLIVDSVAKAFGRFPALGGVSLEAREGEFLALLGPSGSGKTTLLRILAGLETPDTGAVSFNGEDLLRLSARERRIGMVFQHYALFRHMTVAKNIAFGLSVRPRATRPSKDQVAARVADLLRLVQLEELGDRYPAQLSGGQRQRVALARALAIEPRMLLLDEPFGALDAKVRRELRRWLRKVHDETGVTTIFVTHDQEEALDLADRVAILKDGALVQIGAPQAVYDAPADAFVFDFLGGAVRLPGRVEGGRLTLGDWTSKAPTDAPLGDVQVFFRQDQASLRGPDGEGFNALVTGLVQRGPAVRIDLEGLGQSIELLLPPGEVPDQAAPGRILRVAPKAVTLFGGR
ncbi:MAG: sulfate/molybdate ABC transporter ATP-binding protein [Phenylobacterium sp.]|uniref:sulfate/molybdate ABC transporter ATP-binding protein n=1 Tax=Phenylobacterium sp. TaxID=1871053 RepID=UPI001B5E3EC2|nr:sulfate/molybdate ABC transporter ATP-binding protein [Phenylobacterium sp.]MBP7648402.1 sulfate/molybdate ABC transporter ATP-binding protein [Phenylobacterium sp.]MBP7816114.1 sulfate/molybdate ABC transporter ATP-binding protein [Phenylobacterium sp.]MBP9231557.1 sulfate/molybdate ABC transporter ATP-binding protein [Phenylobacterium sp.]MBP9755462.1 sulfate/molybdate ABC transporter ATP-binding protein [Phenylobacterium sp.]